jgi:hypothetical protein
MLPRADEDLPREGSRVQSKRVVVLGVVAVILVILALLGPWWVMNQKGSYMLTTFDDTAEFGPFHWTTTFLDSGYATFLNGTFGPIPNGAVTETTDYSHSLQMGSVFLAGAVLTVSGLASGVAMITLAVMSDSQPSLRKLRAVHGVLAFVLVLAAPLYVMVQLPGAANYDMPWNGFYHGSISPSLVSGFWGSQSAPPNCGCATFVWQAGWAWYALVAAAVLFLICGIMLIRAKMPFAVQAAPKATR